MRKIEYEIIASSFEKEILMQLKSINVIDLLKCFIRDVKFEINELVSTTFRKPFDYRNKHI